MGNHAGLVANAANIRRFLTALFHRCLGVLHGAKPSDDGQSLIEQPMVTITLTLPEAEALRRLAAAGVDRRNIATHDATALDQLAMAIVAATPLEVGR
jgi:hypothetical protein